MAFEQPSAAAKGHKPRDRETSGPEEQWLARIGQQDSGRATLPATQPHSQTLPELKGDDRNSPISNSIKFYGAEGEWLHPCPAGISLPSQLLPGAQLGASPLRISSRICDSISSIWSRVFCQ